MGDERGGNRAASFRPIRGPRGAATSGRLAEPALNETARSAVSFNTTSMRRPPQVKDFWDPKGPIGPFR